MTGIGLLGGRVVAMAGGRGRVADLLALGLQDHGGLVTTFADDRKIDGIVHCALDPDGSRPAPFDTLDDQDWDEQCEAVLRDALDTCRLAHARLAGGGGRVVFITEAFSLVGAAGHAAQAAAFEGVRSMAKSAARQWGSAGITVNCVAAAVDGGPRATEQMALGVLPTVRGEVTGAVAFLLSDAAAGITGTTITVDGGSQMRP